MRKSKPKRTSTTTGSSSGAAWISLVAFLEYLEYLSRNLSSSEQGWQIDAVLIFGITVDHRT